LEICQIEIPNLPEGILLHQVIPNSLMELCICLWEAISVDVIQKYLDTIFENICVNEYMQVNEEFNMGLPESKFLNQ